MQSINEDINDKLLEYYHQIKTDDIILAQKNYLKVIDHKEQQEVKLKELENEEKENNKEFNHSVHKDQSFSKNRVHLPLTNQNTHNYKSEQKFPQFKS